MKINLSLTTADVVVLLVIAALMVVGVRIVIGFFRDGKKKKKTGKSG